MIVNSRHGPGQIGPDVPSDPPRPRLAGHPTPTVGVAENPAVHTGRCETRNPRPPAPNLSTCRRPDGSGSWRERSVLAQIDAGRRRDLAPCRALGWRAGEVGDEVL